MALQKMGGLAGLICAATYLFGFAFLVTLLAPLDYGTIDVDSQAVVECIQAHSGLVILWNLGIYILIALALVFLVVRLHARLQLRTPDLAEVARGMGLIWPALVLGAGMIGNVAVERVAHLAPTNFDKAVLVWDMLHAVELGLGGGNEIAGGVWIALVSVAGLRGQSLGTTRIGLGNPTSIGGLARLFPALGDMAGVVFGLAAIAWFIAVGINLTH